VSSTTAPRPSDIAGAPVVTVFDPFPVLTVTIENQDGQDELHLHAGGQGVWIGRLAVAFGADVRLVTTLGGEAGDVLGRLICAEGIEAASVRASAETAAYVHDRRDGERLTVAEVVPAPLTRHELDELYEEALVGASEAGAFIVAGPLPGTTLPDGTYRRLLSDVAAIQRAIVADLSGPALAEALDVGGIQVLKLSHDELIDSGHATSDDRDELARGLHRLAKCDVANVVVTRGPEPTLALLDGELLEVDLPTFEPHDHRGGGDAMTALLGLSLAVGDPLTEAVLLGAAAGALNATRRGLATVHPDHVRRFRERGRLRPIDDPLEV
jgi:1-phosphofructokinase